jgi:hypothetical protein
MKDCPENTALGNFMFEMKLNQLIITPTRITDTIESLMDVIITSASHVVNESGVISTVVINEHAISMIGEHLKTPKDQSNPL